jgi:hypothetical protein
MAFTYNDLVGAGFHTELASEIMNIGTTATAESLVTAGRLSSEKASYLLNYSSTAAKDLVGIGFSDEQARVLKS